MSINETDVKLFVDSWKQGVLDIRNVYHNKGDYQEQASEFLKTHYLFDTECVFFKPTLTREEIFRNSFDGALSYFIGGDIDEDRGFALQEWKSINTDQINILIEDVLIIAMGVLSFESNEVLKVAFTFILKESNSDLKIKVHHSSLIK
tara:strand:+ start:1354 stop:1797 length:444 start_codon:yes stop_codon:yes gene_type:complete